MAIKGSSHRRGTVGARLGSRSSSNNGGIAVKNAENEVFATAGMLGIHAWRQLEFAAN